MFSKLALPRSLPMSLSWFVVTAIIYLLQVFPYTGIFLMILAAPFWSIITVNAGFIFLALEALARPGLRIWLLAPVIYFGGYAYAAHLSHQEFDRLDNEMRSANAGKSVPFSPSKNDLVLVKDRNSLSVLGSRFVREYNLDVAYDTNPNFKTAGHRSSRIAKHSVCKKIRANPDARAAFIQAGGIRIDKRISKEICSISGPEDPARPAVAISTSRSQRKQWLLPAKIDTLTITSPDGATVELKSGYASPLTWLPLPVMGCALNSGAPSWDCSAVFFRGRQKGLGGKGAYGQANTEIIARALGLRKISTSELVAKAIERMPDALAANITKRRDISFANLQRIIADPTEKLTVHDIKGMRERPDLWQPLVPQMTQTLIRAFDGGYATRERAGMLQDLLNTLSATDYRPAAEEILKGLAMRPDLKRNFVSDATLTRLGELGPVALPVLEQRLAWARGRLNSGAILGLCKVGVPAAHLAGKVANPLLQDERRHNSDQRFVAFVTLLKFGRADLADRLLEGTRLENDATVASVRSKVSERSGPDVCIDRQSWRKRLRRPRRR